MPSTKIRRSAIALSATILLVVACASGAIFFGVLSSITDRDRDASSSSSLEALLDHRNPPTSPHHPQVPHRRMDQLVDDFVPLSCNANLATAVCVPWSRRFGVESVIDKRIVIPCGECVVMDHVSPAIAAATTEDHAQGPPEETDREDNRLTLTLGMDIRGKLVFPDDYSLTLHTALIAVQGQLHISTASTQAPVNGNPSIRIVLTGQDDQFFVPVGENKNVCDKGALCNAGKKGLIVAGGQVDSTYY